MKKTAKPTELPTDVAALQALVLQLSEENALLQEALNSLKKYHFGRRSEKYPVPESQLKIQFFDEVETESSSEAPVLIDLPQEQAKPAQSKKGRQKLAPELPRQDEIIELPETEQCCDCGCQKTCIGETVSERLEIIPAKIFVTRTRRKKYACPSCEGQVATAPMPARLLPKSNAGESLLAFIAVSKYIDALPLYRIESMFQRIDVTLSRATMANWMIQVAEKLKPIYQLLEKELLSQPYLHIDETTVQVLKEPGKKAESNSYMWVRKTGDPSYPAVTLFHYSPSRSAEIAKSLLGAYAGYLQSDDYQAYSPKNFPEAIIMRCMAHARRYFHKALPATALKKKKAVKSKKPSIAEQGMLFFQALYKVEADIKELSPEEKYQARQSQSLPIMEEFDAWRKKMMPACLPKSPIGKAFQYLENNWKYLFVYLTDGRLHIGRVGMWRSSRESLFPHPAHQTGRALLTHPAFVQNYAFALDNSARFRGNLIRPSSLNK